jgi:hypothetical protein
MSTRDDARLTAEERAALSNLEALAAADDPQLAARLRGPGCWAPLVHLHVLRARLARVPRWAHSVWAGVTATVVGLALVVVSLGIGWELGVFGAVMAVAGLTTVAGHATQRLSAER